MQVDEVNSPSETLDESGLITNCLAMCNNLIKTIQDMDVLSVPTETCALNQAKNKSTVIRANFDSVSDQ